jgi:hypothetical protein
VQRPPPAIRFAALVCLFVLILAGCEEHFSAKLPVKDQCLSHLSGSNGRIVEPAGQMLTGYKVVPCDSDEAEFRVAQNALARDGDTPAPCPADLSMVYITSQGELHMTAWSICLVPAP